jgi:HlyD family secretion protein
MNTMSEETGLSGLRMHRSTQQGNTIVQPPRKWLTRLVVPMTIVLVALALLGYAARDSLRPTVAVRTVRVVTKSLTQSTAAVTVQAPGWVEADPFPIYVPALAPGVVKEVLALEGQAVQTGQVVAQLIDDDARLALDLAQAQLATRRAQLDVAQATLKAAQADWDYPIEQDRAVAVAQASIGQITAEKSQLAAEVAMHRAKLAEFDDKHRRLNALLPDATAQLQVVQAALQRDAQESLVLATQTNEDVLDARMLGAQANQEAAQQQRRLRIQESMALDQAGAELAKLRAQVQLAEVEQAQAELRLERMQVRSPASGIVMTRLAVPGSKLMLDMDNEQSANAVHLYDPNKLQVRVDVPLADAAKVGIDHAAEVTVDVLPDTRFAGHVTRIVHKADIQKNTLEVKVAIHDPISQLKPEMLARVKFLARSSENPDEAGAHHVFVPERLLTQRSGDTATVWVVSATQCAIQRDVTLGRHRQQGWIETVSGLNIGDNLIADSDGDLKEGRRVRITGEAHP